MTTKTRGIVFSTMWLIIGMISSYDLYLAVAHREELEQLELNPIGLWLIDLGDGDLSLFMGIKMAGTVTVLGILVLMYAGYKKLAWICCSTVAFLQVWLLVYLLTN